MRVSSIRPAFCALVYVVCALSAWPSAADSRVIEFDRGWKLLALSGEKTTEFQARGNTLQVLSDKAVGFYHHRLLSARQAAQSDWVLSWEWRVMDSSAAVATRTARGDDRPLALHIWLNDPRSAGWLKGSLAKLFAIPTPGHMLTYSWGGTEAKGSQFPNPHIPKTGYIHILRDHSDTGGGWFAERVYFKRDLLRHFGELQRRALYMVVSADNEDSAGFSRAQVRNVILTAVPAPGAEPGQ